MYYAIIIIIIFTLCSFARVFDAVPAGTPIGQGFPGGHSSGGFAYISVYFALTAMRSKYRFYGLFLPLLLGLLFSVTQEIRGAHFPSHDMFSFVVCWLSCQFLSLFFYGTRNSNIALQSGQEATAPTWWLNDELQCYQWIYWRIAHHNTKLTSIITNSLWYPFRPCVFL